jgi:uncharacterized protein YkwD
LVTVNFQRHLYLWKDIALNYQTGRTAHGAKTRMTTYQVSVSPSQWLKIARFIAAVPILVALFVVSLSASETPRAEALDSEEQAFLGIINQYRADNGLGPLQIDSQLNTVARWMADDMANNNYFSHTDSLGRDPFVRMDQLGYTYNTWRGENLVAGTDTADYAFEMWSGSPGHNANMLSSNYTVIGIARAYNSGSTFGWYWATEFGGQTAAPAPPPAAPATPKPAPAPQPDQPQVQPAPAQDISDEPPPAPTATPEPATIMIVDGDDDSSWWQSMLMIGEVPGDAEEESFVEAGAEGLGSVGLLIGR